MIMSMSGGTAWSSERRDRREGGEMDELTTGSGGRVAKKPRGKEGLTNDDAAGLRSTIEEMKSKGEGGGW